MAYVVSFLTIGIIWANHHTVMNQIARADRTFLMLTVGFLLVVAFIPFPTRLVAEYIAAQAARAATVTYGITLTLTAVMFNAIWFYAARGGRLLRDGRRRTDRPRHLEDLRPRALDLLGRRTLVGDRSDRGRDRVPPLRLVLGDRELGLRSRSFRLRRHLTTR